MNIIAEFMHWTAEDKEIAINMQITGCTHKAIGEAIHKSRSAVSNFFKRLNYDFEQKDKPKKKVRLGIRNRQLNKTEEARRMNVYDSGASDRQGGETLGMSADTFCAWRISRGLPINKSTEVWVRPVSEKVLNPLVKEHVVLTADDAKKYYKCNDNSKKLEKYTSPITVIADREAVERELSRWGIVSKCKIAEGPVSSQMGIIIGSKWDKDRLNNITAKQDTYSRSVGRMVAHG